MPRPRLAIRWDKMDWILEFLALVGLFLAITQPIYHLTLIPDTVPQHFNMQGDADDFGRKWVIWFLVALGIFAHLGMTVINRYPHKFNYSRAITSENAQHQYTLATKLLRSIKVILVWSLAYIIGAVIQTALETSDGLNSAFVSTLLGAIVIISTSFLYASSRKESAHN
ncbi:MAG: DUF1648 domain-containing protein [Saprospiraceae bacterium]|nr:DUF1648 domain-containing protein [Saprospiraceae bacterium]